MLPLPLDPHPVLKQLVHAGRGRGWICYEEINTCLPDCYVDPDAIDAFMMVVRLDGIELIDEIERRRAARAGYSGDGAHLAGEIGVTMLLLVRGRGQTPFVSCLSLSNALIATTATPTATHRAHCDDSLVSRSGPRRIVCVHVACDCV